MTEHKRLKPVTATTTPKSPATEGHAATERQHRADSRQIPGHVEKAALDFRDELLAKNWPDAAQVALLARWPVTQEEATGYASELCKQGMLLGVWAVAIHAFVYPMFQFDGNGQIRPEVTDLLSILPSEEDRGGWRRAFWLYSPHVLLGGRTPAEEFVIAPHHVVTAARREFTDSRDKHW
ncbi:hypothetical protein [Paraburkholderia aspalathi]|uniref:hypothetical protein n=1 Tax=Paraburkholderia aspalathi TaxID=1324617 RepID=UPI0038BBBC4A